MDITDTIAANLSAWMNTTPGLDTIQKVEKKSGVGFGTIRRARNGDGNITVEKLSAIAKAFGKTAKDLVSAEDLTGDVSLSGNGKHAAHAAQSVAPYAVSRWPMPYVDQNAYESLNDAGKVWVQARTTAAIEEAARQFGTQSGKRTA